MIAAGKLSSLPRNSPVNHQFSLASSMDLLTTKPSPIEHRSNSFQGISIHGTLPRKKKGTVPSRSCDMFSHVGTLPYTRARQQLPFIQDIIEEYPPENGKSSTLHDRYVVKLQLAYVSCIGIIAYSSRPIKAQSQVQLFTITKLGFLPSIQFGSWWKT